MEFRKFNSFRDAPSVSMGTVNFVNRGYAKAQIDNEEPADYDASVDVDVDLQEIYFLIMHFLSAGPCQKTFGQLSAELLEHKLLPRRYHAWYSRDAVGCGQENDDGTSFHLNYDNLVERYPHIEKTHLLKLLKKLMLITSPPSRCIAGSRAPTAADVPTLLGSGSFSLLSCERNKVNNQDKSLPSYLRWPHMQADQVRGLRLREIGGGFSRHHRAPSIRLACYAIAKPSVLVSKMQNKKKLRGHRDAVYCAIFDRSGRYVITGSDDRLVKIWSMETAFCLASCRGHEGDITDLSVSSNNALVASASNDYSIRVWRLPDGYPISVLRGHTGAVTAIAFCPRAAAIYQLLSSSDDGTCRVWEARSSQCNPRVYLPKPTDETPGKSSGFPGSASSSTALQRHQILCCAYNANGTVFVTGSSDTFARVWNACKPTTDNPEQPSHEIDILIGHENDVNYVQFSGCAIASRSSPAESFVEDSFPKFKNSWHSHDNIVTCSRDGSAIIWIPRSRRSHGKVGRWIRSYHLKVPPPPMPPQPPRGGPRQRLLPTPRGVNMIVWSLDNRFVLAAIMDNRICVWNANDGSLVHSLAGHTASTYVLDVHPFNPRIAMSAGYDGKTILWDIWEGTPIRVYEIDGRFKLVDGKFSQDGTSLVLSDDVGQIYLLNTGEGESQKDAKYDQFFLGDYRPLIRDTHGNVVDQETQLVPYKRNIQDALCDSSMLPYPEPYQSMYQKRRLGALGIEWRPSSIKFAVGTDIGMGQEFQILPLADLDVALEPLPDYLDALYWEPEIEGMNDDNDSEYNFTEEYISDEQICPSDIASSDSECSEENKVRRNKKDSARRSKRKKPVLELKLINSSGRRVKKRIWDEQDGTSSRSKRYKNSKNRTSRKKHPESKPSRPQRVAARNALNSFSQVTEASFDSMDDDEEKDCSVGDSSDSESSFEHNGNLQNNEQMKYSGVVKVESSDGSEDAVRILNHPDILINGENRKKLVLKFSLNNRNKPSVLENPMSQLNSQASASTSLTANEENPQEDRVHLRPCNQGSSSTSVVDKELPETYTSQSIDAEKPTETDNVTASWGKFKIRTSGTQFGNVMPRIVNTINTDACLLDEDKCSLPDLSSLHSNQQLDGDSLASFNKKDFQGGGNGSSSFHLGGSSNISPGEKGCEEPQNSSNKKLTVIKIKNKKLPGNSPNPPGKTRSDASFGVPDEKLIPIIDKSFIQFSVAENKDAELDNPQGIVAEMPNLDADVVRKSRSLKLKVTSRKTDPVNHAFEVSEDYLQPGTSRDLETPLTKDIDYVHGDDNNSNIGFRNQDIVAEMPDLYTDVVRRSRSFKLKSISRGINLVNHSFGMDGGYLQPGTSRVSEKSLKKDIDQFSEEGWMSTSKHTVRYRSSQNKREEYSSGNRNVFTGRNSEHVPKKVNWLLLSEQEEGYRYIPQLGDEVVYLIQGHQGYMESSMTSQSGKGLPNGNKIRSAEVCLVDDLKYTTLSGSGLSSCQITLRFTDTSCDLIGQKIRVTLPELNDFPDFIVEKTRYDDAIERNWTIGDKCHVWWRDESEEGGAWWIGRIVDIKDKSSDFPGSPWERCVIQYENDTTDHFHSPWELHDPDSSWHPPKMDWQIRHEILCSLDELIRKASKNKDRYGILKLNEAAQKMEFINRFPAPLCPEIIRARLENYYYRSIKAVRHDIRVMLSNAESYFQRNSEHLRKMKHLSSWFDRELQTYEM